MIGVSLGCTGAVAFDRGRWPGAAGQGTSGCLAISCLLAGGHLLIDYVLDLVEVSRQRLAGLSPRASACWRLPGLGRCLKGVTMW